MTTTEGNSPPGSEWERLPKQLLGCIGAVERGAEPAAAASWYRVMRRPLLAIATVALIVMAISYLESGRALPWQGRASAAKSGLQVGGIRQDGQDGYVSFESQGITLGAAGGSGPKIGEAAPDFTLLDLNGKPVRLHDLRGKTVVMNFWATWCIPCRQEFPELVKLYQANAGQGLVVLGVDVQESADSVRAFAGQYGAEYPIVIDQTGDVNRQYRVLGLPTTWFIDSAGVIRAQFLGPLTPVAIANKLGDTGFTAAKAP
ncbi:MAG: TlpA family protein disulfide reductase [Dehalococcoidia bacterium]